MGPARRSATVVGLCGSGLAAATLAVAAGSFNFQRSIGLYDAWDDAGVVIELGDSTLVPGDSLVLVSRYEGPGDEEGEPLVAAIVDGRAEASRSVNPLDEAGRVLYRLRVLPGALDESPIGLGVVAPSRGFRWTGGRVESDLDGDGLVERYSECASYEGIHFEVWEGTPPYEGDPLIDAYYYVPYSLDPTCPGMEEEDPSGESPPDSTTAPPPGTDPD